MEDSIKSFKSDIFDYKLLANAHKRYIFRRLKSYRFFSFRLAEIFEYQEDFLSKVKDENDLSTSVLACKQNLAQQVDFKSLK